MLKEYMLNAYVGSMRRKGTATKINMRQTAEGWQASETKTDNNADKAMNTSSLNSSQRSEQSQKQKVEGGIKEKMTLKQISCICY